jgi:hypothetical protein
MGGMRIITIAEEANTAELQPDPNQDVELLLASANAIQRLVAERDALRSRVEILERELTGLRQQTTLVHDSYRTLTTEFVTQFQLIDRAVNDLFREPSESAEASPAEQPAEAAAFAHHHHAA